MKVSETINNFNEPDDCVFAILSAINPETGKVQLICRTQYKFDGNNQIWKEILNWEVVKEFLTNAEIEEFNKTK